MLIVHGSGDFKFIILEILIQRSHNKYLDGKPGKTEHKANKQRQCITSNM